MESSDRVSYTGMLNGDPTDEESAGDYSDEEVAKDRGWEAKYVTACFCCFWMIAVAIGIPLCYSMSEGTGDYITIRDKKAHEWAYRLVSASNGTSSGKGKLHFDEGVLASMLGLQEWHQLSSFVFVLVGWGSIVIAQFVTTLEVNESPHLVPADFEKKGTLSNCTQDISQPNGRMFTVGLFTFGLLYLISHYTVWLYRPWAPWIDPNVPYNAIQFEHSNEKNWRCAWLLIPNVFLMFTAAFPSLSDADGYKFWLMIIHNICAPLGMAFGIYMETTQLNFGENAFGYFFTSDPTPIYGPLTITQRARVVTCVMAWLHGVIFLSVQVYLGLGTVLRLPCVKPSYAIALISYYGEVGGLTIVALMPALAGLGTQLETPGLPTVLAIAANLTHNEL